MEKQLHAGRSSKGGKNGPQPHRLAKQEGTHHERKWGVWQGWG